MNVFELDSNTQWYLFKKIQYTFKRKNNEQKEFLMLNTNYAVQNEKKIRILYCCQMLVEIEKIKRFHKS